MRIAVVGPGAMGCLFAAFLAEAKYEVWLIDKDRSRSQQISKKGVSVEGISGCHQQRVKITTDPAKISGVDLFIICVKSYATAEAGQRIAPAVGPKTMILTLQNGSGNLEILEKLFGPEKIIGGVTSQGATLLGVGHIRHAGRGETIIGRPDGRLTSGLRHIARVLNQAGFPAKISKDIHSLIWSKLIINVGINALTALTRLNNGRLVEYSGTKEVLRLAVAEAVQVAGKQRIKLVYNDPVAKVEGVCAATAGNVSSMLQDVLRQRRTEIEFINGVIVREGKRLRIATPINTVLYQLVRTLEESYKNRVK